MTFATLDAQARLRLEGADRFPWQAPGRTPAAKPRPVTVTAVTLMLDGALVLYVTGAPGVASVRTHVDDPALPEAVAERLGSISRTLRAAQREITNGA